MGIDKMLGNQTFYQPAFKLQIPNLTLMVEKCVYRVTEMTLFFQSITTLVTQQGS